MVTLIDSTVRVTTRQSDNPADRQRAGDGVG